MNNSSINNQSVLGGLEIDTPLANSSNETDYLNPFELYDTHSYASIIDRAVTPIFYFIGLPTNPLSAYIWLNRKSRQNNSSAIYLGALSISHMVFLLLHIPQELRYAWGISTYDGNVSCEIFNTIFNIPQYLAPLLVLGFTVERYIAICHPFAKERFCTVRRAVIVVCSMLAFCVAISFPLAYIWTYDEVFHSCNHRTELQNGDFIELWYWITELSLFGVAPLAALLFNIFVIREIQKLTSGGPAHGGGVGGGSQASTVTLLCVSFYLICTWLPFTIVYCLASKFPIGDTTISIHQVEHDVAWQKHLTFHTISNIIKEITMSNYACYFFIYYTTGKHFRDRVHELLCPRHFRTANRNNSAKEYMAVSKYTHTNGDATAMTRI